MDKRSDDIRQDIEATRASLDEKIDLLESKATEAVDKAKETFDLKHQVAERPWVALGAAVAAGYVLGSLGGESSEEQRWHGQPATTVDYNSHAPRDSGPSATSKIKEKGADFLSQFDDEIELLKGAAMATLTSFLRDTIRQSVPALGQQLDKARGDRGSGASYSGVSQPSGGLNRSTATNNSTEVGVNEGRTNQDEMPEWNRYGTPPPTPTRDESEYFTTYKPSGDQDERSVGESSRY